MVKVTGKGTRIISSHQGPRRLRSALSSDIATTPQLPQQARTGWGAVTWRKPIASSSPRVVNIGYWDLCGIGYDLQRGFEQYTDWDYRTVTLDRSWVWEPQACDLRINNGLYDEDWLEDLVMCADILHLNGISAYLLPFVSRLNLRGKKIFIHHHAFALRNNHQKWEQLETEAGYGRLVSTPDLLCYASPGYKRDLHWLPSPIDLSVFDRHYPRWEKPDDGPLHVLHGYTISGNKGTAMFTPIVDELQKAGENIELGLMTHLPQHQARWYLSQADVYFATFLYGPGIGTLEAMALGIPVLVGCTEKELAVHRQAIRVRKAEDLPWIYASPDPTSPHYAGKWLQRLAHEPALRQYWADKGRKYMEKWHDLSQVVKKLKCWYEEAEPAKGIIINDTIKYF